MNGYWEMGGAVTLAIGLQEPIEPNAFKAFVTLSIRHRRENQKSNRYLCQSYEFLPPFPLLPSPFFFRYRLINDDSLQTDSHG